MYATYHHHPPTLVFDRQRSVQGSSAGAGSDFFGKYQKHRTIEMERLRKMDEDWDKMQKVILITTLINSEQHDDVLY